MKVLLTTLLLIFAFHVRAQSHGKAVLYGYKEPVSKGVSPQKTIDESGRETEQGNTSAFNYFIYLVSKSRVYPSEMWLNGQPYAVSIETIQKTPVERKNFNNPSEVTTTELVPQTNDQVIRLKPVTAVEEKLSEKGRDLSASNELVVVYKQNGKFYYNTLKSLKILEAALLQ